MPKALVTIRRWMFRRRSVAMGLPAGLAMLMLLVASFGMPACSWGFSLMKDRGRGLDSFTALVNSPDGIPFEIRRVLVEGPYYNGLPGFNVLVIRKYLDPVLSGPRDLLTVLVRGNLRLAGFWGDADEGHVLAFYMLQKGAGMKIREIRAYDTERPEGRVIGPSGAYQYGSVSPDGGWAILVDSAVTIVNLADGAYRLQGLEPPLAGLEADPPHKTSTGYNVGGSVDLTGKFMRMQWEDDSSGGILMVRDPEGDVLRLIAVEVR